MKKRSHNVKARLSAGDPYLRPSDPEKKMKAGLGPVKKRSWDKAEEKARLALEKNKKAIELGTGSNKQSTYRLRKTRDRRHPSTY